MSTSFHYDEDIVVVDTARPPKETRNNSVRDHVPICVLCNDTTKPRLIPKKTLYGLLKLIKDKQDAPQLPCTLLES